jgi:hypothetical protein
VYAEAGEQFDETECMLYDAQGKLCIPDGRLRSALMPYVVDQVARSFNRRQNLSLSKGLSSTPLRRC